ncbi:hypothetical protein COCC4DRAFT_49166 [Bipolaris maydis ATCC 48331]|uniref:AT DNA binding protein n=1 Tax=Cochliobolus heterostrophus (strain C4 / ATCC 48331 / race T) TaxID=665024 RepID=N4X6G3_COCH4|nr:uncharacterized protein COCC4DRAFT_49166 [Bipolaris maydis ATCC 48331]ENI07270.1 hypothetical protein COCC4DRAFT_49166 [Bipolaris maydis ATCC 48331]KAJ5027619.1 hypothetical protein J3E73DRAFT_430571 [Bipolaris maydis]KAJ6266737.1 hypothetical protein PSV08DRAFT_210108 [Bipolaris maydis]
MAPRGRSITASPGAYSDRSNDSSPDPLAISFDENITSSHRKSSPRKPIMISSPRKQVRRLETSEVVFSSPSKSMIMSTPRGNGASPWRIKVTVQAEPEDGENAESPSVKRVTRTKTTTVPLKDPDASSPVKRPRGRPRKSETGLTPKPKRKGTPIKRPAEFSSPSKIVRGGDSSAADVDTDVPPRKRRGRPRKSVQPPTEYDETSVAEEAEAILQATFEETPLQSTEAGLDNSKKNARFSAPDDQTMDDALRTSPTRSEPSPSLGTPAHTNSRSNVRARRGTPHANKVAVIESDEGESGSDVLTPASGDEDNNDLPENQPLSGTEDGQGDVLTPSETSAQSSDSADASSDDGVPEYPQDYEDDDEETQGQHFTFDEGATRMPDDTTMLDSETFSMISVESLKSNTNRPSPTQPRDVHTNAPKAKSSLRNEYLGPATHVASGSGSSIYEKHVSTSQAPVETAPIETVRPKLARHVTPAMDSEIPSAPPALHPVQPALTKSPSPTLGRAVTAGVALQGLLDPTRLTPDASQKTPDGKRGSLDDLFRGFSSGTRKDLQAGLRLGEQLAQNQTEEDNVPGPSSPIRGQSAAGPKAGVFRTQRKYQQSRLLTPEDQDHVVTAVAPAVAASDVQYPVLDVEEATTAPLSPARSESAMSWRTDTPPRAAKSQDQQDTAMNEVQEEIPVPAEEAVQHDDFGDIWQEEASRSVISINPEEVPTEKSPEAHDIFTDANVARPPRGRAARIWRRRKVINETESQQEPTSVRSGPAAVQQSEGGKEAEKVDSAQPDEQPMQAEEPNAEGEESDAGMFFQSNVPNVTDQKRPSRFQRRRPRRQEAEKVSLSELLDQGDSFMPESPSPVKTKKTPPKAALNPFLDTPPRFPALLNSPKKSSPLRRELHSGDISTSSVQQYEESTLPLAQSSPFHTVVDGDSKISAASDQQQFRMEMEGNTASTIIRVREEANEYLDAYEPQERSLNEITEVTEPSRTHQDISHLPSSPPKMQRQFEQRLLSARKPSPLSKTAERPGNVPVPQSRQNAARSKEPEVIELSSESSSSDDEEEEVEEEEEESDATPSGHPQPRAQPAATLSAKPASSRSSQLQPHPILSRMTPLPKVEPWTRTHYKALDKLYTTHLKHPALFCPFNVPPTPLSTTNGYLLRRFLADNGNLPYVGAVFHAWGYSMVMTAELVVLCSVFMDLMSLKSEVEYEQVTGRKLEVGNCAPGRRGDWISGEDVLQRLATVVMGESVRRDERAGLEIDRSRGLQIEWPQTPR